MNTTWAPCLVELQTICSRESLFPFLSEQSLMGWKRGHGLCSPQPPSWLVGTPPSSLPRSHGLGDLRGSHREETGAPALDRQRSLAPALLPTAEKQEKVIIFEFLRFAFNFFTPPLRSSLKTSSVYGGY